MPEYVVRFTRQEEDGERSLDFPITGTGWFTHSGELRQEQARKFLKDMKENDKDEVAQITFWIKNDDGTEKEIPVLKLVK